jgi:hypothetical protein
LSPAVVIAAIPSPSPRVRGEVNVFAEMMSGVVESPLAFGER